MAKARVDDIPQGSEEEKKVEQELEGPSLEDATETTAGKFDPNKHISMLRYIERAHLGVPTWPVVSRPGAASCEPAEAHFRLSNAGTSALEQVNDDVVSSISQGGFWAWHKAGGYSRTGVSPQFWAIRSISVSVRVECANGPCPPLSFQMVQSRDADQCYSANSGNMLLQQDSTYGWVTRADPRSFLIDEAVDGGSLDFTVGKCFLLQRPNDFGTYWRLAYSSFPVGSGEDKVANSTVGEITAYVNIKVNQDFQPPTPNLIEVLRAGSKVKVKMQDKVAVSQAQMDAYAGMHWPVNVGYRLDSPAFRWPIPPYRHSTDTATSTIWYDGVSDEPPIQDPLTVKVVRQMQAAAAKKASRPKAKKGGKKKK